MESFVVCGGYLSLLLGSVLNIVKAALCPFQKSSASKQSRSSVPSVTIFQAKFQLLAQILGNAQVPLARGIR